MPSVVLVLSVLCCADLHEHADAAEEREGLAVCVRADQDGMQGVPCVEKHAGAPGLVQVCELGLHRRDEGGDAAGGDDAGDAGGVPDVCVCERAETQAAVYILIYMHI